jgi:hypothetical protein
MFLMVSHIVLSFLCCSLKLGTYCSFSRLPSAVAFILTRFHIFVAVVKAEVVLYGDLSLLQRYHSFRKDGTSQLWTVDVKSELRTIL